MIGMVAVMALCVMLASGAPNIIAADDISHGVYAFHLKNTNIVLLQVMLPGTQDYLLEAPLWGAPLPPGVFELTGYLAGKMHACTSIHRAVLPPIAATMRPNQQGTFISLCMESSPFNVRLVSILMGRGIIPVIPGANSDILTVLLPCDATNCTSFEGALAFPGGKHSWHVSTGITSLTVNIQTKPNGGKASSSFVETDVATTFSRIPESAKATKAQGTPSQVTFTPSERLLASGLYDPQSPCAGTVAAFVHCVQHQRDVGACRAQQREYMKCQRSKVEGSNESAQEVEQSPAEGGIHAGDSKSMRFSVSGATSTTLSKLGNSAVQHASAASGLTVDELQSLCTALGDGDCPVQTMTNVPLPVMAAPSVSGGLGPFGPDLSGVAGLVIGAIINGVVGPEIIEMVQAFIAKIMVVVPPVLRKVLVDGVDPLSSLPPFPQIPDPASIVEQAMAQVEAAKAVALANLERAKAAVQLAKSTAEQSIAKAKAFQAEMSALYAQLRTQAAAQLQTAKEAGRRLMQAATQQAADLRSAAQSHLADARKAAMGVVQGMKSELRTKMAQAQAAVSEAKSDAMQALQTELEQANSLESLEATIRGPLKRILPLEDIRNMTERLQSSLQSISHALRGVTSKEQDISQLLASAQAQADTLQRRVHEDASQVLTSIGDVSDLNLGAVRQRMTSEQPMSHELVHQAQSRWQAVQAAAAADVQRVKVATDTLKSASAAVLHAKEQEAMALEESQAIKQAIAEQEEVRKKRNAQRREPVLLEEHLQQPPKPTAKQGRRGILAVILHYELSHALTTALTLSTTKSFHHGLVDQLHDALEQPLRASLTTDLAGRIGAVVTEALEAALPQTVPPLLERSLPQIINQGVAAVVTHTLTDIVGNVVVDAVSKHLLNTPETVACCDRCKLTGERVPCDCCNSGMHHDDARRSAIASKVRRYSEHYSALAIRSWATAHNSTQPTGK